MTQYIPETAYNGISFTIDQANFTEFEGCVFTDCDFSACTFLAVTFIDCSFNDCVFSGARINYVAFRTAYFTNCFFVDVNFAMCDKLIFEVHFDRCVLDFAKFYTLKLKGTTFSNCSVIAADFMKTDLTGVLFDNCDLHRASFMDSTLIKADFATSRNYTFDPARNKVGKAIFSRNGLKGLLAKHEIVVV